MVQMQVMTHCIEQANTELYLCSAWFCLGSKLSGRTLVAPTKTDRVVLLIFGSLFCSVPFFSHPRSESWPHHGCTFSVYPCALSFWLTLPRRVLSTSWCCPSRPCMVFLACVHLALFLALSLSPGNSLVSSWCDQSFLDLAVSNSSLFTPALLRTHSFVFFAVHETYRIFLSPFISKTCFFILCNDAKYF